MSTMSGKTVLITGATNGIGLTTAQALAAKGAQLFLHGRSPERGQAVVASIRRATGNPAVEFVEGDFANLASVRALASEMKRRAPRLDVLINNAGRMEIGYRKTADGFESMFGVNHLAPFLLTNLLLDQLKAGAPARIVVVASGAHRGKPLDLGNLNFEKGGFGVWPAYHASKLCNMLFTLALAKRLAGSGVTANALHPGVVRTGLGQDGTPLIGQAIARFVGRFFISPEEGARTSIYLACAPEVEGVSGKYFDECRPARPDRCALDEAAAERLWEISAKLAGLSI